MEILCILLQVQQDGANEMISKAIALTKRPVPLPLVGRPSPQQRKEAANASQQPTPFPGIPQFMQNLSSKDAIQYAEGIRGKSTCLGSKRSMPELDSSALQHKKPVVKATKASKDTARLLVV